jgi:AcrR family transcriptional regulator
LPKTKEQFQEIRNKSKEIIMGTALELFANNGFHSTSISSIAQKAGISKGLMYNYFASKEDLLRAIIMSEFQEGAQVLEEEFKLPATPKEHLEHIIDNMGNMLKHRRTHFKLLTALSLQEDVNKLIVSELMPKKDVLIQQFIHLLEAIGLAKPKEEAYLIGAMLDGLALHYLTLGEAYPLDEMLRFIKEKYC